ncbi:hypothetical protein QJQ45_022632, partial [Haematococcus lacustris]
VGKACAFVTDTPSTNKAAWRLVEQRHPKVLSVGCWMHILDLYLHGTPVAIALSWLKRQQELQQEEHCQAWMAGSRELLAEAIPLFKARWRYGDSQVLYLAAILDPRYKMLDFQFSPAQFSQAEQALSRLVTVDDSQADQPVAMALEQLRRGWGAPPSELLSRTQLSPIHFAPHLTAHPLQWWAERRGFAPLLQAAAQRVLCSPATAAANERVFSSFKHIWSDKRSSLLLGRMWLLAFIYFNKRVLERRPKPQPEAEWQQFAHPENDGPLGQVKESFKQGSRTGKSAATNAAAQPATVAASPLTGASSDANVADAGTAGPAYASLSAPGQPQASLGLWHCRLCRRSSSLRGCYICSRPRRIRRSGHRHPAAPS